MLIQTKELLRNVCVSMREQLSSCPQSRHPSQLQQPARWQQQAGAGRCLLSRWKYSRCVSHASQGAGEQMRRGGTRQQPAGMSTGRASSAPLASVLAESNSAAGWGTCVFYHWGGGKSLCLLALPGRGTPGGIWGICHPRFLAVGMPLGLVGTCYFDGFILLHFSPFHVTWIAHFFLVWCWHTFLGIEPHLNTIS